MPGGMPAASTNNKAPASTLGDMSRNLFSALFARRVFGRSTSRARATSKSLSCDLPVQRAFCVSLTRICYTSLEVLMFKILSSCNGMLVNKVLASDLTL